MQAGINLAANWMQVRRLELEVYPDNAPAIALYEKLGFAREGRYRDFSFQDGLYTDALVMSRLFDVEAQFGSPLDAETHASK